ncbi:MAG: ParB/RepB/Spo0J family partition protein [Abditibacteriales bacterium]|nr:ParB/RepB/Spo0J family partition protein [Abditibacteriales bacterium]MDW8367483.1 ParB/RepB/Spo0J family partition protein [Abditibacteriales bacterium]
MLKRGLGRGLSALIPGAESAPEVAPQSIPVDMIDPNPYQPRGQINEEELAELAQSIATHGVLQPIVVRPLNGRYQLIAGERRWQASRRAGLMTIPAVVKNCTDREMLEFALIENLQREDINAIDAARAYARLAREFHLTQEELSQRVGKSRSAVANTMRLLDLPEEVQQSIIEGRISEGHGRALLGAPDQSSLMAVFRRVMQEGLNVRATEKLIQRAAIAAQQRTVKPKELDPDLLAVQERLQTALGTRVRIIPHGKGGTVQIEYFSMDDLNHMVEMLLSGNQGNREIGKSDHSPVF